MTTTADTPKQARALVDSLIQGAARLQNFSDADLVQFGREDLGRIDQLIWELVDLIDEGPGIEDAW